MNLNIEFDHRYLSLLELQNRDIPSTSWLEEALFDPFGGLYDITEPSDPHPLFFTVGFCKEMIPILYVFEMRDKLYSRQARKASKEEVKNFWC